MATTELDGVEVELLHQRQLGLIGHEKLETTQIYTHVSIAKLKEIHSATHPARMRKRTEHTSDAEGAEADELLDALAAEAKNELEAEGGEV